MVLIELVIYMLIDLHEQLQINGQACFKANLLNKPYNQYKIATRGKCIDWMNEFKQTAYFSVAKNAR